MRNAVLAALVLAVALPVAAAPLLPEDIDRLPSSRPALTVAYGSDRNQVGDLRLPPGRGPFPVAVVVHGGCWTAGFATRRNTAALASALSARGIATWNIDYRQLGDVGAGWPGTFADWAAGTDYLRVLARRYPLDLTRVYTIGHSAGAHAALWIASRPRLPLSSAIRGRSPLPIRAAVALDGPADLAPMVGVDAEICGKPAIVPLLGGTPEAVPRRYAEASPEQNLPLGVPQYIVAAAVTPPSIAEAYRVLATRRGDRVSVLVLRGAGHFDMLAPGLARWAEVEPFLMRAFGMRTGR